MVDTSKLIRENIRNLEPYSSAREEYKGKEATFLDANEIPYNVPYNRYPDPLQWELKEAIGRIKEVMPHRVFLGNGSDEAIDLILRAFCEPGIDNVITIDPTYGMYQVAAAINNIYVKKIRLRERFRLPTEDLLQAVDRYSKIIILCSPNNPTGNCFRREEILRIASNFDGLLVVDEAYIDFAPEKSILPYINEYQNIIVLHTFSKAWGLAGIRLGMAFAHSDIIAVLNKIKYPYNVNVLTLRKALQRIKKVKKKYKWVRTIVRNREKLMEELRALSVVEDIFSSDANFFLIKVREPQLLYNYLVEQKIIIRDRSKLALCEGCLRITVGTHSENKRLIRAFQNYSKNTYHR